jgi:hypothetical protein
MIATRKYRRIETPPNLEKAAFAADEIADNS